MTKTPLVVVAGRYGTDQVCDALGQRPGTLVVRHRFDGQVVVRTVSIQRLGQLGVSQRPIEVGDSVDATIRADLLPLLRRLHRRDDVDRIVVHLPPWTEPENVCWALANIDVHVGPGYIDGAATRDIRIDAVVATVDTAHWLCEALGDADDDDDHDDGGHHDVAQIAVSEAEFADVIVLSAPEPRTRSVLRRLAPRAHVVVGVEHVESTLAALATNTDARRDYEHDPHTHLLAGEPPLDADDGVALIEFYADRPFHPARLHTAIDDLLDGVIRVRGRAWLASQPDTVVWIESAGGGLRIGHAGTWLAAADPGEWDDDPTRIALAQLRWDERFGDRHIALTVLVCGADPARIRHALSHAVLTDEELSHAEVWPTYPDPFGDWHEDPCDDAAGADIAAWRDNSEIGDDDEPS